MQQRGYNISNGGENADEAQPLGSETYLLRPNMGDRLCFEVNNLLSLLYSYHSLAEKLGETVCVIPPKDCPEMSAPLKDNTYSCEA